MRKEKSITVNALRREANLERWDPPRAKKGVRVKARDQFGNEFDVIGFQKDRDALVLSVEQIEVEVPAEGEIEPV